MATPRHAPTSKPKVLGGGKKIKIVETGNSDLMKPPEMKPRKKFVKKDDKYQDRAAMRRSGADNEFTEVEKLKLDFDVRTAGLDPAMIASQQQYLGGDAQHSVIVKGLDLSLLEMMKNKQKLVEEEDFDDIERNLDQELGKVKPSKEGKSREEIRREMKERLASGNQKVEVEKEEKTQASSKFKPIGRSKKAKPTSETTINPSTGEPEKKRRKKKVIPSSTTSQPKPSTSKLPPSPSTPISNPNISTFDSDEDIFGSAEIYKAESSSDEDNPKQKSTISSAATRNLVKRSYFDDEPEDKSISTAPSSIQNLTTTSSTSSNFQHPSTQQNRSESPEIDPSRPLGRLQGFSTSSISATDLLALDSAATKIEERKAKKAKYGKLGEGEEKAEKVLTEEDKANRDYLAMERFMEKKSGKKGKGSEEED